MDPVISLYSPDDLDQIVDILQPILQQIVSIKVYNEWILGTSIAILTITIVLIFSVFFSNMSR